MVDIHKRLEDDVAGDRFTTGSHPVAAEETRNRQGEALAEP